VNWSYKMWLYIVPFSEGQITSLKQTPNACFSQAFSRKWRKCYVLYFCDSPF
jgi:hypothetical protein